MSDMSSLAGDHGAPVTVFSHAGKDYPVSRLGQLVKTHFEQWVKDMAWAALNAMRPHVPAEEYQAEKAALLRRQSLGYYSYHGPLCQEAQSTQAGGFKLASLLFGCSEEEMLRIAAEGRTADVQEVLDRVIAESVSPEVRKQAEAQREANAAAVAVSAAGAGLPGPNG